MEHLLHGSHQEIWCTNGLTQAQINKQSQFLWIISCSPLLIISITDKSTKSSSKKSLSYLFPIDFTSSSLFWIIHIFVLIYFWSISVSVLNFIVPVQIYLSYIRNYQFETVIIFNVCQIYHSVHLQLTPTISDFIYTTKEKGFEKLQKQKI